MCVHCKTSLAVSKAAEMAFYSLVFPVADSVICFVHSWSQVVSLTTITQQSHKW